MSKIQINTINTITVEELDRVVEEVYGKPYRYQQQDRYRFPGTQTIFVPTYGHDFENRVCDVIDGQDRGVSFEAWLDAEHDDTDREHWYQYCYPSLDSILNDLHKKDVIEAGTYILIID